MNFCREGLFEMRNMVVRSALVKMVYIAAYLQHIGGIFCIYPHNCGNLQHTAQFLETIDYVHETLQRVSQRTKKGSGGERKGSGGERKGCG